MYIWEIEDDTNLYPPTSSLEPGSRVDLVYLLPDNEYNRFLLDCVLSGRGYYEYGKRVVIIADDSLTKEYLYVKNIIPSPNRRDGESDMGDQRKE